MKCLIFGTTYIDGPDRLRLLNQWIDLNERLNPDCDLLIVDTPSGYTFEPTSNRPLMIERFKDNIGHMARGGRDGWGRAFCRGLELAMFGKYDYVAHVEGDSLCRLPIKRMFAEMSKNAIHIASVPVMGTKKQEHEWVETGLMLMSVSHVFKIGLISRYDWPAGGKLYPNNTPERVLFKLIGDDLTMMSWRAYRDQARRLKPVDVAQIDWVTDTPREVFDAFYAAARTGADYTSQFFSDHEVWQNDYQVIADILAKRLQFDQATDLGCGNGYIIRRLRELGKVVLGYDASPNVLKHWPEAIIRDLEKPLSVGSADLVICTEVAEHLAESAADTLVNSICNLAMKTVFFSAAKSGRGGEHHLNEQEQKYWIEKFVRCGFFLDLQTTMEIRWEIADKTSATWWFAVNTMVFRRG